VALVGRAASEFRDRAAERVVGTEVNCQARIVVGRVEVVEDDMVVGGCGTGGSGWMKSR